MLWHWIACAWCLPCISLLLQWIESIVSSSYPRNQEPSHCFRHTINLDAWCIHLPHQWWNIQTLDVSELLVAYWESRNPVCINQACLRVAWPNRYLKWRLLMNRFWKKAHLPAIQQSILFQSQVGEHLHFYHSGHLRLMQRRRFRSHY